MQAILVDDTYEHGEKFINDELKKMPTPKFAFDLLYEHAACLQPGMYVNDSIINEFNRLLCLLHPHPEVIVVSTFFHLKMEEWALKPTSNIVKQMVEWEHSKYPRGILNYETIFYIINYPGSHWALVRIETGKKELHMYDSLAPEGLSKMHIKKLDNIKKFLKNSLNDNVSDSPANRWTYHNAGCPQQHDVENGPGTDCGIFVIMCLLRFFEGKKIDFDQKYIYQNRIREKIFSNIYNRNLQLHKL
jgi:Ulp1 family protease